jgi:hypothetical protein
MFAIYDKTGKQRASAWLTREFGPVRAEVEHEDVRPLYKVASVHEIDDLNAAQREIHAPATIVVTVLDAEGNPEAGKKVAFYWPDAPEDPGAGHLARCVIGWTDVNGVVGFGMGRGAYYTPPEEGPHMVWLWGPGQSERLVGLGMIAGSNHRHLNVRLQRDEGQGGPGPINPEDQAKLLLMEAIQFSDAALELHQRTLENMRLALALLRGEVTPDNDS